MNTLFPHKISRRTIWHSSDGVTLQIDYILAPRRFKSSINRAKSATFPGGDINIDHDLVTMTVKLKLKKSLGPRLKFNLEKLKDPEVADLFEATIGGKFAAFNLLEENIDTLTKSIHGALVDTASKVLGKSRKRKKRWMTDDVLDQCDRRSLKKIRQNGPVAMQKNSEVNQEIISTHLR